MNSIRVLFEVSILHILNYKIIFLLISSNFHGEDLDILEELSTLNTNLFQQKEITNLDLYYLEQESTIEDTTIKMSIICIPFIVVIPKYQSK